MDLKNEAGQMNLNEALDIVKKLKGDVNLVGAKYENGIWYLCPARTSPPVIKVYPDGTVEED